MTGCSAPHIGGPRSWPINRANPLRVAAALIVGWIYSLGFSLVVVTVALITFGRFSHWLTPMELRSWGRGALRIQGVKVEYEGLEHLRGPGTRVATFNHASGLDAMLIPTLYPPGGVSAIKREALYIPLVGAALWVMGFLFVDRGKGEKAKRSMRKMAERMRSEQLTLFVAPEGTRSPDGALQPFKKGAFHIAMASGAPIVPVVTTGAFELFPRHRWVARPGTVRVAVLPPISTEGLTLETMPAFIESVREIYLEALARPFDPYA